MISHRHRCIYIKMPKCASSSVRDWFLAHGAGRHSFPPYWYPGSLPHRLQWTVRALRLYPGYFAFTFLRDPHRRFLSLHRHANRLARQRAARDPRHPPTVGSPEQFAALCAELLDETRLLWGAPASAFLRRNAERRYGPLGIRLRHLPFVFGHARPQVDFLPGGNPEGLFGPHHPTPARLDFIGAVETIDTDFDRLRETLRLPAAPLPRHNAAPAVAPHGEPPRYDDAARRRVEALYAEDLAFLAARPAGNDAPTDRPLCEATARPPAGTGLKRAGYNLLTLEIGLEQRLRRAPAWRRPLAPLARLRRKLQ